MNDKQTHTPGPYDIYRLPNGAGDGKGKPYIITGITQARIPSCTVHVFTGGKYVLLVDEVAQHEYIGNAAAFQDLLDALKRIMEQIADTGTVSMYEGVRACAAIAKAEKGA